MADFLWGGSAPANATQVGLTDQASLPVWYQEYLRGNINKASGIAATPYTQYTAPRIASFNADQNAGFQGVRDTVGNWQPNMTAAGNSVQRGSEYDKNYFNDNFMNPYTSGVMDDITRRSNQNLTQNILPGVMNTFTGGGQFGSARNMDMANRAIRDQQDTMTGQLFTAGQSAWDSGQKAYSDWGTKAIQGGSALGNLAGQQQAAGLKDAAALDTIGRTQQQQTQANLDLAHQDFVDARDWDKNQSQFLASTIQGYQNVPSSQGGVNTSFQNISGQSPLAALAGGAATAVAAAQPTVQRAKGGLVKAKCGGLMSLPTKKKGKK